MANLNLKIEATVYFEQIGQADLFIYLQESDKEGIHQDLTFEEVLRNSLKGLTPIEKREVKAKVAKY